MRRIEIYTTPTCPDCHRLKGWFTAMALRFVEHDLSHPVISDEAKRRTGVWIAPITLIDGEVITGQAADQIKRIRSLIGLPHAA